MSKAKEQTQTLKRHHASCFVPLDKRAIAALVESMRKDGYREQFPILLMKDEDNGEDMIVDGWHRYQASIEAGVEPVFKYLSDLGITPENGEGLAGYVVAANVCRRQMNSKRMVLALLRSGLKGLSESTLMNMTGASSSTVRGGLSYHQLLPKKTQESLLNGEVTTAMADSVVKRKRGTTNTHRAARVAPPSLSPVIMGEMAMVQDLEKVSWIKAWQAAAEMYVAAVKEKHSSSE